MKRRDSKKRPKPRPKGEWPTIRIGSWADFVRLMESLPADPLRTEGKR